MTRRHIKHEKEELSQELESEVEESQEIVRELGLEPRPVRYWINDNSEVNKLASYGGFQKRYPHWRWGMKYNQQQIQDQYAGGKIFEMVINDDPCHAYLQMSNDYVEQKAVITHVEAHSDFFANNKWFQDNPDAVDMLARHADQIESYMEDPDISREEVEKWIDNILCLQDNIDQYGKYIYQRREIKSEDEDDDVDPLESLNLSDEVERSVFTDDFFEDDLSEKSQYEDREMDLLYYLLSNGETYDKVSDRAVEMEDWQKDILEILREESYYFAPQMMTKVMNEGWAAYVESLVMTDENFADSEGIIDYADQHSKVLQSQGLNPYRLGKALWEHLENTVNRREVVDKLLRIDGVTPDNFKREIDFQDVHDELDERDSDDIVVRNYSLTRNQNQGFIQEITLDELRKINRYIVERDRYSSEEEAIEDVDYRRGWNRMLEVRETHNDVMFIDEFLTQEFVDNNNYYTYEYRVADCSMEIASRDVEDVRKKLLLEFTNFGKPQIEAVSDNYKNSGELLLVHRYNGIVLDMEKAKSVIERMFDLWGRPVNLATVGKMYSENEIDYALSERVEPVPEEIPAIIRYDGDEWEEWEIEENTELAQMVQADEVDYDTKPDDWL